MTGIATLAILDPFSINHVKIMIKGNLSFLNGLMKFLNFRNYISK